MAELTEIANAEVRHGVVLEVASDALERVHLLRVGGAELERDATALRLNEMP